MVFKIFISYSQGDFLTRGKKVHNYLTQVFPEDDVFIDQAKPKAKKWRFENEKKLNECNLVILIVTPLALQSSEVKREIEISQNLKKQILPCKISSLKKDWNDLPWNLGSFNGIDFVDDEELRTELYGEIIEIKKEFPYEKRNISNSDYESITVKINKNQYVEGDEIDISGSVGEILSNVPVSIQIISPNGNLVSVLQAQINSEKKFQTKLITGGTLWSSSGIYTIKALYGTISNLAEITFEFNSSHTVKTVIPKDNMCPVEGTDFFINYQINNGSVTKITKDVSASSLIVLTDIQKKSTFHITIPRNLLDARINDNDDNFFVLIDGEEISFKEIKTAFDRTLSFPIPKNGHEIEIIGTPFVGNSLSFPTFQIEKELDHNQNNNTHILSISTSFDRTVYPLKSKIYLRVNAPETILGKLITLEVFTLDEKLISSKKINPATYPNTILKKSGIYETTIKMNNEDWMIDKIYRVKATHGNAFAEDTCIVDERNPVIQTDKSVYLWGSDIIITVIDPDADKDSNKIEFVGNRQDSYLTISSSQGTISRYKLRETGESTGIFQGIIGIIGAVGKKTVRPYKLGNRIISKNQGKGIDDGFLKVERGGEIIFTYSNKKSTVELHAFASNFGASIELNKKIYDCNDRVYVTIVAPDYNFNSNKVDFIGHVPESQIKIKTSKGITPFYKLQETGKDTGIFTGEFTLKLSESIKNKRKSIASRTGPTNGIIMTSKDDFLEVTLNFFGGTTIVGRALIKKTELI